MDADDDVNERLSLTCLFCPHTTPTLSLLWQHLSQQHGFDFPALSSSLHLDFYCRVRLVNLVRASVRDGLSVEAVQARVRGQQWLQDDALLQPVMQDDAVLMSLGEEDDEWDDDGDDDEEKDDEDNDDDDEDDERTETTVSGRRQPPRFVSLCISHLHPADVCCVLAV